MPATIDFYLARVAQCDKEAQETNLANVKERCLRSKAAWQIMSDPLSFVTPQIASAAQRTHRNHGEPAPSPYWHHTF